MKKYRLYVVVALLVAPSLVVSGAVLSTPTLPEIDGNAQAYQQQNCPVDGGFGCFIGSQSSPLTFCSQFMQMFLRPGN